MSTPKSLTIIKRSSALLPLWSAVDLSEMTLKKKMPFLDFPDAFGAQIL
jgi:hypothetical protein